MVYAPLSGTGLQFEVANALRDLANKAHPNSARSFHTRMAEWPNAVGLGTVTDVLKGRSSPINLKSHAAVIAEAITLAIPNMNEEDRTKEIRHIADVYDEASQPPARAKEWGRDITQHCLSVAFDWASALPEGPRDAYEVIATIALSAPTQLKIEVLDPEVDHFVQYGVMEGSRSRTHLGGGMWRTHRDDGSTWHGIWGPKNGVRATGSRGKTGFLLAVHMDAFGAVSVYSRTVMRSEDRDLVATAALTDALSIVRALNWTGEAGVLVRVARPSPHAQKSGLIRWENLAKNTITLAAGPGDATDRAIVTNLIYTLDGDLPVTQERYDDWRTGK